MTEADAARDFVQKIVERYPDLRVRAGRKFAFRPARTIVYEEIPRREGRGEELLAKTGVGLTLNEYKLSLLHELGHALLEHREFRTDAERVKMERAAWEKARELCAEYGVEYDEKFVEGRLDTYRDWLHRKSLCPECGLTRYQTRDGEYHCPGCGFNKRT